MTKVKICGLMRPQDIESMNRCLPDYAGFVFAGGRHSVSPVEAFGLIAKLRSSIVPVGVFVDEREDVVAGIAAACCLGVVQLHGNENNAYISNLRALLPSDTLIFKTARVRNFESLAGAMHIDCDMLLLDTYVDGQPGGTGAAFDWGLLEGFGRPYLLAGGLNEDNVAGAVARLRPFGVDVSSGVETNGRKDRDKIERFIDRTRRCK